MLMEVLLGPNHIVGGSSLMDQRRNTDSDSSSLDNEEEEVDSSSDSSIGAPDDSEEEEVVEEEEEEEEEEDGGSNNGCAGGSSISEEATALKKGGFGSLGSLASLEDSLPIKRGLSIHMSGKSKSFTNLSEAASSMGSVKDLEKTEHPFNKKRRVLRWSRRNYYKLGGQNNPKSMPVLPLIKDDEEEEEEEEEEDEGRQQNNSKHHPHLNQSSSSSERGSRGTREAAECGFLGYNKQLFTKQRPIFKSSSYSCFSLADLPEHEEEEEDDDNDNDDD